MSESLNSLKEREEIKLDLNKTVIKSECIKFMNNKYNLGLNIKQLYTSEEIEKIKYTINGDSIINKLKDNIIFTYYKDVLDDIDNLRIDFLKVLYYMLNNISEDGPTPRSRSASLHAVGSGTAVRLTTCFRCWLDDFECLFPRLVGKNLRVLLLSVLPVTGPSHCLDCVDPSCAAHTGEIAQCLRAPAWPFFLFCRPFHDGFRPCFLFQYSNNTFTILVDLPASFWYDRIPISLF